MNYYLYENVELRTKAVVLLLEGSVGAGYSVVKVVKPLEHPLKGKWLNHKGSFSTKTENLTQLIEPNDILKTIL